MDTPAVTLSEKLVREKAMPLLRPALVLFALLTLLTGVLYPLAVTGIAKLTFNDRAEGSIVLRNGVPVGSELIGQAFTNPAYFWGRPSATSPQPYNGAASTGTNQATTNPALLDAIKTRVAALRAADPGNTRAVPVDLVTASGSGLDPQISPAAADYQAARIARLRGLPLARVQELVAASTSGRFLGLLGEPRVDVLKLNLALDDVAPMK
jgi:K+-transporting ATPase ATPase C chain